jgi:drug/metabolite transporter (DMT)-like permease
MQTDIAIRRAMGPLEWGMLLTLSVLWGGSFFFVGVAVKELPTFTVVVARVALAAIILICVIRLLGLPMPKGRRAWQALFCMAFINNVIPFSLIAWGQAHIASGVASILNATTPLFTVIIAHYFTGDEKMSWGRFLGVLIGLTGVAVMVGIDALDSLGVNVTAQLAVVGASICYAISGVYARRFRRMGLQPLAISAGQMTASTTMLVPVMLIIDQPWTLPMPSAETVAALIGLASLSTALAYLLYFRILATAGATNVLLVTFLLPVTAILLGILVLGEVLHLQHIAGMALIGLGLASIDGRVFRLLARSRPAQEVKASPAVDGS